MGKTQQLLQIFDECRNLFEERNKKYGDSYEVLDVHSIAKLCEMKMNRISNMEGNAKIEDEFMDTINYAIIGIYKHRSQK